jgi:hypothetical protein
MKFGKLLSLVGAVLIAGNVMADIVQPDAAANVARNFMYERYVQQGSSLNVFDVVPVLSDTRLAIDQPAFYIFDIENGGWVIVSAEDSYTPIIGYSPEGKFPKMELAAHYNSFLQEYVDQIIFARENNVSATSEVAYQWASLEMPSGSRIMPDGNRDVEPLVDILWNQDFPYNAYCPVDPQGPGDHVYAGCVATAMSMIMYYYRYPEVGNGTYSYNASGYGVQTADFGSTYYNWDAMVNSLNASMGESVNAIAELQYHCGVAVGMMYSWDGSGAFSNNVPAAIKTYFKYANSAQYMQKMSYTLPVWENMIIEQIDVEQPLYYSGQGSDGGHAFLLDGYQITGTGKLFHFNFGWSGSGNGYYTLSDVGGFASQQAMVRNFIPNSDFYPYAPDNKIITVPIGSIQDPSGPTIDYLANSVYTWLIRPTDSVTSITLNVLEIDFGAGDVLNVYDGADENAPLLATYAQGASVTPLTSSGREMFIKFLTDGSEEGDGFRAEFTSAFPVYCTNSITNLTSETGNVSDGSGDFKYNNGTVCKWRISPGPWAKQLTLSFNEFELGDGDFLKVFEIPSNDLLADLTGSDLPAPLVSSTGQMMLMFSSNGYNNAQGFDADYYIANVNADNEDFTKNLSIFPNPASSYTDIKFNVTEPTQVKISVMNLLGEVIYSEPSTLINGFFNKTIQLGDYSKGVYLIKIDSDNGTVTKKLIVK